MLVVAGVHFQQYIDFMSEVPTIGVLFLLNAAGGAALALMLAQAEPRLRLPAALGGVGLVVGALVSILIAMGGGLFGYQEPTWRLPVVFAVIAEVAAIPALGAYLLSATGARRRTG